MDNNNKPKTIIIEPKSNTNPQGYSTLVHQNDPNVARFLQATKIRLLNSDELQASPNRPMINTKFQEVKKAVLSGINSNNRNITSSSANNIPFVSLIQKEDVNSQNSSPSKIIIHLNQPNNGININSINIQQSSLGSNTNFSGSQPMKVIIGQPLNSFSSNISFAKSNPVVSTINIKANQSVTSLISMRPAIPNTQRLILPAVSNHVYTTNILQNAQVINQKIFDNSKSSMSYISPQPTLLSITSTPSSLDYYSNIDDRKSKISQNTANFGNHRVVNKNTAIDPAKQKKACNCTKSQCLKLYCECFANGEFCRDCNCMNCMNNLDYEDNRYRAIKSCMDRNPLAFHPKIGKGGTSRSHSKGCNCKRSNCLKNYCECYEAKIACSNLCRCIGCQNSEENSDRQKLLQLAFAAEVRGQQQEAAESRLSKHIHGTEYPSYKIKQPGEKLPYSFITLEVIEAIGSCLIAEAEENEQRKTNDCNSDDVLRLMSETEERAILEEFSRCITSVIEMSSKSKAVRN